MYFYVLNYFSQILTLIGESPIRVELGDLFSGMN